MVSMYNLSLFIQALKGHVLYLNPFLVAGSLDNPVDVDAGYVDVLFSKGPDIHHLLHLQRQRVMSSTFTCTMSHNH